MNKFACIRGFILICLVFALNSVQRASEQSEVQLMQQMLKKVAPATGRHTGSKYAFFTLLAGIDPYDTIPLSQPASYLGYLLHLAAVRYMLDKVGSKMDVVILLRLAKGARSNTLPASQEAFFSKLGMKIEYLPQGDDDWESFMMEKFQILRHHEYKQILFFDADVLPLCNWDHYFDMSERGTFAPNLVFGYRNEPAQGAFFLISPEPGDWEAYRKIHFINSTMGFGTALEQPAESSRHTYTDWNWHGAADDQGMLYHWVRYVKKNVTLVNKDRVQKWVEVNGKVKMVEEVQNFNITCPNPIEVVKETRTSGYPVTRDFVHYTGYKKPWQRVNWTLSVIEENTRSRERFEMWSFALREAWRKYELGPVRQLMPNMFKRLSSVGRDMELVEGFLSSSSSTEEAFNPQKKQFNPR